MIKSIENDMDIEHQIDKYVNNQLSKEEIDNLWFELIQDQYHLDFLKTCVNLKSILTTTNIVPL